ncbi:DUF202 domain-containing protein [Microbacterium sp. C7(2022)]|uniref:DUF202 domain-containing protein n=1 Tax=Microbacterium sp. C7(2022) TaxID=2992759 RepID=UPI00237BF867|nr:DUF202 domain-containing protein [Microbacterium sp. C7(2022)]MDE0546250.1 DUF202 domain-containing protein [Microbacterium sp. C7(2022)]
MRPSDFDKGLQPERTELAWRRTTLSLAVGSLVAMRLLPTILGDPLWFIPGLVGLLIAVGLWSATRHRYARVSHATITHGDRAELPDGKLPLWLAIATFAIGLFGMCVLVVITAVR